MLTVPSFDERQTKLLPWTHTSGREVLGTSGSVAVLRCTFSGSVLPQRACPLSPPFLLSLRGLRSSFRL